MKVTILLADSAQALNGKLYILGGGWSVVPPGPTPMALAVKVEVPWNEANKKQTVKLELVDSDRNPFMVATPMGDQPFHIEAKLEVGRPPGAKPGVPLDVPLAFNFLLNLPADKRFEWICSINGHTDDNWKVAFTTLPESNPKNP